MRRIFEEVSVLHLVAEAHLSLPEEVIHGIEIMTVNHEIHPVTFAEMMIVQIGRDEMRGLLTLVVTDHMSEDARDQPRLLDLAETLKRI